MFMHMHKCTLENGGLARTVIQETIVVKTACLVDPCKVFYLLRSAAPFLSTSQYISETDEGIRSARREERLNLFSLDPDTPVSKIKTSEICLLSLFV